MRTRFGWLAIFALLILVSTGCGSTGGDYYDTFLRNMYVGTIPVRAGETVNIPLHTTYSLRFEFNRPVTVESLNRLLSFTIIIQNMRTGGSMVFTDPYLLSNGELVWANDSNNVVEFHLSHPLTYLNYGGFDPTLGGAPGDTYRVFVQNMVGEAEDGTQFAFVSDEFFVVWTGQPAEDPVIRPWSSNILTDFVLGNVLIRPGMVANVPFESTYEMTFFLERPVSEPSLTQVLDFEVWIENVDSGTTFLLTETNLPSNGDLVWVGADNKTIELRLDHGLNYFYSGSERIYLGSPGDTFNITLVKLIGNAQDGNTFTFGGDKFTVIWAQNNGEI